MTTYQYIQSIHIKGYNYDQQVHSIYHRLYPSFPFPLYSNTVSIISIYNIHTYINNILHTNTYP